MFARILAGIAGCASAGGALYLLGVLDALRTGVQSQEQIILPIIVVVTIIVGHLFGSAVKQRQFAAALFCAAMFCLGTVVTILASITRQTLTAEQRHLDAGDLNERRGVLEEALRRHRKMLKEEVELRPGKCPADIDQRTTAERRECNRVRESVGVYEGTVKADLAELAKIGPGVAEVSGAQKIADALALLGGSASNTKQVIEALQPFAYSLFLELTSILCFGRALAHSRGLERGVGTSQIQPLNPTPDQPESNPPNPTPPNQPPVPTRAKRFHGLFRVVRGGLDSGVGLAVNPTLFQPLESNPWSVLVSLADQGLVTTPQTKLYPLLGFKTRLALREWLKEQEAAGRITMKTDRKGTVISIK